MAQLPDVLTFRESGLDGFPTALWFGLMAPAATPPAVIMKLNDSINAGVRTPETQAAIAKLGLQPQTLSAQEFSAVLGKA